MSFRPADPHGATIRLLVIAERLYDAIAAREADVVHALLESAAASSLPRQVREEALAIVALPAASHRVPMALLRYHHRLTELARADQDPGEAFRFLDAEVEPDDDGDDVGTDGPRVDPAQMEIRW